MIAWDNGRPSEFRCGDFLWESGGSGRVVVVVGVVVVKVWWKRRRRSMGGRRRRRRGFKEGFRVGGEVVVGRSKEVCSFEKVGGCIFFGFEWWGCLLLGFFCGGRKV